MSEPDRVSLAFIWDTASPRFSRRTFMKTMGFAAAAGFAAACGSSGSGKSSSTGTKAEPKTLNFYNWTDYIADDTIPNFQKETGIKVTYDNYSSNDELFAKLSVGQHRLRHHRADRRHPREDEARRPRGAARPLADPERQEPRPAVPQRGLRPRQRVLDPVAVGHDRASASTRPRSAARSPTGTRSTCRRSRASRRSSTRRATRSRWRCSR